MIWNWVRYDSDLRMWLGPFVMAGINTRVVRRSNALQGWAYGRRFRYREVTGFGAGPAAPMVGTAVSAALKTVEAGLTFGPSRVLLASSRQHPARAQRKDPSHGLVPHPDPHAHLGRSAVPGHHRSPRRPGLRRDVGHARRKRAVPRAGPGPAARPGRRSDASHGDGYRAR